MQCEELLKKQQKLTNLKQKRYFKNELKYWKTLWSRDWWRHVPLLVMKKYQVENYFPANFLYRVIKSWLSTALGLVSRPFRSCQKPIYLEASSPI